jgi:hypothetical protein
MSLAPARVRRYTGPACPRCGNEIDPGAILSNPVSCPVCLREFEAVLFDPPPSGASVPRVAEAGPEGANPCGHHPGNVAAEHCTRCGVFMCALCRIETDGRVLCPACFERLVDAGELPSLVAHYRDYGHMQLSLVLLGLVIVALGALSGPAAPYFVVVGMVMGPSSIYFGVKERERRRRIDDPGGGIRHTVLFVLAAVEALAGLWAIASMVTG